MMKQTLQVLRQQWHNYIDGADPGFPGGGGFQPTISSIFSENDMNVNKTGPGEEEHGQDFTM